MSYLADMYRNFDVIRFAEENASMVSFQNCIELPSIVFVGCQGSGKMSILGQLLEKFRLPTSSSPLEPDIQKEELRNVMFKVPIVDCPSSFCSNQPLSIFEGCKIAVCVIDVTKELPMELLMSLNNIKESLSPSPQFHVYLHKADLLDQQSINTIIPSIENEIQRALPNSLIHQTSTINGSALLQVSLCIESLLPKLKELKKAMTQFAKSLELTKAYLVDLQSRTFFLSSGNRESQGIDTENFLLCQDAIEMFVGVATMVDARSQQSVASVELKDGTFFHLFWSTYDILLVGLSGGRIPTATAKNNAIALLHTIRRLLK